MQFRRCELFFSAYFLYLIAVVAFRPVAPEIRTLVITLNIAVIAWFCLFAWAHAGKGFEILDHVRDWYPAPLILLAYREMGWIALPQNSTAFEDYWIGLDRALLDGGLRAAIESLGPVLPNLLEFSYLLVYAVPVVGLIILYKVSARGRIDDYMSILLFGTLTAYAMYPWFPSEPPRTVFPGADLPMMSVLRRFNLYIVGGYGIHTSVFPSGHSAAAFSAAFGLMRVLPERPVWGRAMMILAILIAFATIYGRYHYAIDTVAGLMLALVGWGVSTRFRKGGRQALNLRPNEPPR